MSFTAIDPATGDTISTHADTDPGDAFAVVRLAHQAQTEWCRTGMKERSGLLANLGRLLGDRKSRYAELMTSEMGKPISQALAEVEKCAWLCEYYADHAAEFLAPVAVDTDASTSYWCYRPLGIVLGIMPWNFPFWQVIRFAAPAITAGNAALLKHAPSVPGCALALEAIFSDAGYPPNVFRNLFADVPLTGELIEHPLVRAVSLTGSVRAGRSVAARAGGVIKKCVLELGGSDPSVVLGDADMELAVNSCFAGRMLNAGQSCIAAKRFVVVESVLNAFQEAIVERMSATVMGDPMDPATELGPMARLDLRDTLHDQVIRSVHSGARLLVGGVVPDRPGAWYPATVLAGVGPGMPAYHEELFGPVATIIPVVDEEDAIRVANATSFGLGASVYTADTEKGERIARDMLDAGNCFVNGMVKSDPRLPFGGTKESGYGRELSPLGLREFTNVKTVWVR